MANTFFAGQTDYIEKLNELATANITISSKTSAYTAVSADRGTQFDCSGTWTFSFHPCSSLGLGWTCVIINTGIGNITLDPDNSELIDNSSTYIVTPGQKVSIYCNGSTLSIINELPFRIKQYPILQTSTWLPFSSGENLVSSIEYTGQSSTIYLEVSASLIISVSTGATSYVSTSTGNGTWTLRTMPVSATWNIGTNGDTCLAVASGSTSTALSTNGGISWPSATALPGNSSGKPVYLSGIWMVPTNTTTYYTSPDGVSWTTRTAPISVLYFRKIGSMVLIFSTGVNIYTTTNGIDWTSGALPANADSATAFGIDSDNSLQYFTTTYNVYKTVDGSTWDSTGITLPSGTLPYTINNIVCHGGGTAPTYTLDINAWNGWVSRSSVATFSTAKLFGSKVYIGMYPGKVCVVQYGSNGALGYFRK